MDETNFQTRDTAGPEHSTEAVASEEKLPEVAEGGAAVAAPGGLERGASGSSSASVGRTGSFLKNARDAKRANRRKTQKQRRNRGTIERAVIAFDKNRSAPEHSEIQGAELVEVPNHDPQPDFEMPVPDELPLYQLDFKHMEAWVSAPYLAGVFARGMRSLRYDRSLAFHALTVLKGQSPDEPDARRNFSCVSTRTLVDAPTIWRMELSTSMPTNCWLARTRMCCGMVA